MTDETKTPAPYPPGTAFVALIPSDELDYDNGKPGYTVDIVLPQKGVIDRLSMVALGLGLCAQDAKWSLNILGKIMDRLENVPEEEKEAVVAGKGKWAPKNYKRYKGE